MARVRVSNTKQIEQTMNKLQHLLTKLAEEGSEIAQIALKTQQFGPSEVMPGQPLTNYQRCHQELNDLHAIVEMLNDYHDFGYQPDREAIENKKAKVLKYLAYSIELGMVDDGDSNRWECYRT
jgi:hypothetical protein